ncbi:MAG TPA: STAS domain-containing protein [Candidatus Obscuribacterales bacterium]
MQSTLVRPQMTIVEPSGYVNASNAVEFQGQLAKAVSSPGLSIVLVDMEQVEYIDSAGLMALVSALNLAQSLQRRFSICSVSPSVKMIFELTQLDRVFEIFENRDAFEATIA